MKRILILVSLLLATQSIFANEARIISMGKSDAFFMDEMSIFRSPGNISLYSNLLIGDFGNYMDSKKSEANTYVLKNEDPVKPWFSAIAGLGGQGDDNLGMFSIGMAVNRIDKYDTLWFDNYSDKLADLEKYSPKMPIDLLVGYNLGNVKLGARGHISMGKWTDSNEGQSTIEKSSTIARGSIGARFNVSDGNELEVSLGGNLARIDTNSNAGVVPQNQIGYSAFARMFMQASPATDVVISGDYDKFKYTETDEISEINAGVGFNFLIDRGFLWAGMSGRFNTTKYGGIGAQVEDNLTAAVLNFGIERNVWWDWLVMRLGGNKVFGQKEIKSGGHTETMLYTNKDATKLPDDAIGFGIGLNLEDKLRFDAVVAEDILFTGSNLMSGNTHHVFTKLSGTLAF